MPAFSCLGGHRRGIIVILLVLALVGAVGRTSWAFRFDRSAVAEYVRVEFGHPGLANVQPWFSMLDRAASMSGIQAQLASVNDFWNLSIQEGDDPTIWKRDDYWATPLETLARGMADCEDFVIGKYFSLVHLGVPPDQLRLIYVRAKVDGRSIAHMVLGYYESPDADPLILDNLKHTIRPATQRRDLTPVFSFNAEGVYVAGGARGSVDRISRWQDLLVRMQKEGFNP